ncbi:MAG: chbP 2, partial [Proteobacteria bacterium]|nr:chbP 2 [Pseudomonadota bacterium]
MSRAIEAGSLDSLAAGIAAWHEETADPRRPRGSGRRMQRQLAPRFDAIYSRLATFTAPAGSSEASGVEWLLDNHYLIRGALNQLGQDLPPGHYRHLPAVRDEQGRPAPRLGRITRLLLDATGMPLDLERMQAAVLRLEADLPFRLGELWALPVFLRAELLRQLADAASGILSRPEHVVADDDGSAGPASGTVISTCILGLRQLATFRWLDFVERTSLVEEALRNDPAGVYGRMDFTSRDRYRRAVEEVADRCGLAEPHVARVAVDMAGLQAPGADSCRRHVGYFLVDEGREALEQRVTARPGMAERLSRLARRHATGAYLGLILVPALTLVLLASWVLAAQGLAAAWVPLFAALAVMPATSLATLAANWLVTQLVPPQTLPRLDFELGISADWPTAVVVPAMLSGTEEVRRLARNLELNYLGNADPALRFALLTDFPDAASERDACDEERLALAVAAIDELNARYGDDARRPFALFHRRRQWNEAEACWMGWERKRGKLAEFNRLLLGDRDTSFECCHADMAEFRRVRLVITLDADTRMPAGVAASLAGILAHPLNRPVIDASTGRVARGYTAVQPRVETDPSSVEETPFARLFAGDVALDPYVHAVSDVYQDLFGAGIFAGKGAYDLAAFHATLDGRIPENQVLSHDLLEGAHGRVGYASDIMLLEDFPASLAEMVRRMHRWVRGDWQLLPWLFRGRSRGAWQPARLAAIDRWKLVDNLRRSLQPASQVALLLLVWLAAPEPWLWTLVLVALPGAPAAVQFVTASRSAAWRWGTWMSTLRDVTERVAGEALRWVANLAFLVFEAWVATDAILRALYRQYVSRRRLLEWEPAAATATRLRGAVTTARSYVRMWPSWAFGLAALLVVAWLRPAAIVVVVPVVGLWCLAPWLAAALGRATPPRVGARLTAEQVTELRVLARRTWRFFEQFVGPDGHWLPPDNVQVAPGFQVAQRTSPTNIGLTLLATLSARDFGYLTSGELVTRLEGMLHTLTRLPTYRGHLYNWYETRNLRPLEPRYVSTVDSGNLVAALIAVRQALLSVDVDPQPLPRVRLGLADTVSLLERLLQDVGREPDGETASALAGRLGQVRRELVAGRVDLPAVLRSIVELVTGELEPELLRMVERGVSPARLRQVEDLSGWIRCLRIQVEAAGRAPEDPQDLSRRAARLCMDIDALVTATDFRFLFDPRRKLFHIGYNASAGEVDGSYYDLLASEARIASFVAIAKGDAPAGHWMHLGRPLRRVRGYRTLLSWSATAFEYLMPRLLMMTPESGLLFHSCLVAVAEQRRAAGRLG